MFSFLSHYFLGNLNGTDGPSPTMSAAEQLQYSLLLRHINLKVGILFASKAIVQLISNPFVGPLTNRSVKVVLHSENSQVGIGIVLIYLCTEFMFYIDIKGS